MLTGKERDRKKGQTASAVERECFQSGGQIGKEAEIKRPGKIE